ncbi:unnamed protein product, partial [Allacma fusca]
MQSDKGGSFPLLIEIYGQKGALELFRSGRFR